ncbi:MAG: GreA/GreB family elongation factor [Candidatus Hydrogenedentes bacterium]|nr:GreA/GreB family elongation factor [Candidatus Hydrogenedentota bacterium]
MSVCLEGMLTAFTSYWSDPLQSDNLAKVARHMRTVLLRGIVPPTGQADGDTAASITESRAIYISRYDLERLQELLEVVRAFGSNENREHADILEEELKRARITNPREVPPDVVTMNSKVRVTSPKTGTDHVYTLVFPRKADLAPENVSILDSFGTALLGRRLRDVFTVGSGRDALMFEVTQILYQPEAAGDFHL